MYRVRLVNSDPVPYTLNPCNSYAHWRHRLNTNELAHRTFCHLKNMSESAPEILRTHELRLLHCTFSSPPSDRPAASQTQTSRNRLHEPLDSFVSSIVSGDYQKALASNAARLVLGLVDQSPGQFTDSTECAERVYTELLECAEKFVISEFENEEDRFYRLMIVVCIAIASFLAFTQSNVTG